MNSLCDTFSPEIQKANAVREPKRMRKLCLRGVFLLLHSKCSTTAPFREKVVGRALESRGQKCVPVVSLSMGRHSAHPDQLSLRFLGTIRIFGLGTAKASKISKIGK